MSKPSLRVIGGNLRRRAILAAELPNLRPMSSRIKKSLFDTLAPLLPGAEFLDLFAGTGAVGLEALSRGAARAAFVEKNRQCVRLIEENISRTGFSPKAKVFHADALKPLAWLLDRADTEGFDLVFMGPPYRDASNQQVFWGAPALALAIEARLAKPGGFLIVQHHAREKVAEPPGVAKKRERQYGDTILSFFRRAPATPLFGSLDI